ncbi:hypothetical protein [Agrococcus sp. ARC_14]|uniref:hypothetical protein n=1 Tax=Agrococcus sp. ARC_14 TaxID=2919927 RepID=UPI001F0691D0|nr:hypothetical protein [Agrococcus sp. ARC_14]MCH1881562.1 hypothetical protein [Agrococcus sp. ARC_14]
MTTKLTGEIASYAELIGAAKDDARVLAKMQASPHFREQAPFLDPDSGATWIVVESASDGVRMQFRDGALAKASFEVAGSAHLDAHGEAEHLISGLDLSTASKEAVVEQLGAPAKRGRTSLQYVIDGVTLTVAFLNDRVRAVTVSDGKR